MKFRPETSNNLLTPCNLAWAALMIATGLSWWFGQTAQGTADYSQAAMAGVIITAFIKVWIIGYQFMELKSAPWWLRLVFNAWTILACLILLMISWQ